MSSLIIIIASVIYTIFWSISHNGKKENNMVTIVDNKCDKDTVFETTCDLCGSKFTYQSEDVKYDPHFNSIGNMRCPCCGNLIFIPYNRAYPKFMKDSQTQ